MIHACVIGFPLQKTLSPAIHNYWFEEYRIKGNYAALPIPPEKLQSEIGALQFKHYAGFNVTIPHKRAVMLICRTFTPAALAIGAVNTVVLDSEGGLHGRNTDAYGFAENLKRHAPDRDWTKTSALVLGAGGAARAVIYALRAMGASITITNRTAETADALADTFGCATCAWEEKERVLPATTLLVNTTSLGMTGKPSLDLDLKNLPRASIVADIVYTPLMTPLLQMAAERGNPIVTGIGMLLHQAAPAFQGWTHILPEVTPELESCILGLAA